MQGSQLLKAAVNLDYSARVLIQYLLSSVAESVGDKVIPWLDAAVNAKADVVLEARVVKLVMAGAKLPGTDEVAKKALLDKIEKLEAFSQLATAVVAELRSQLDLPTGNEDCNET